MFEPSHPVRSSQAALTCLTEVELAMIGGRMARAFMVEDAPWFDELLAAIDQAGAPSPDVIA